MHAFIPAEGSESFLIDELSRSGISARVLNSFTLTDQLPEPSILAFALQTLPNATVVTEASINGWADHIIAAMLVALNDDQPWRLHLWPAYGEGKAGQHRCELILAALPERLKKRRRSRLRSWQKDSVITQSGEALVQAVLTSPETGFVSAAPITEGLSAILSNHIAGYIPHAEDKAAPSRAFAKVVEAELRLGHQIERGQTCVDLGASPGSWSYVAIQRGAHVTAIDRSPLRNDLMRSPSAQISFKPMHLNSSLRHLVDWLICDIIAAPQRSIDLLLEWLREKQMRRFIVTLKFKGTDEYHLMDQLKKDAPPLCADFRLMRLCANKNEVTAFGLTAEVNNCS
jgi:23S rRNA (cytidine2498-2'-O)-methyltransferase